MMKKYLLSFAVLASAMLFTACEKDNGKSYVTLPVSKGAFVICGGHSSGIGSSLTYIDYSSGNAAQNQFKAVNHRELGMTANDALVYGEKLYIVVSGENTVEVLDTKTMRSIKQIKMVDLMGEKGHSPRCITADGGMIYVSTYGSSAADRNTNTTSGNGYVAAIDTLTFSLKTTYVAGSFPEGVAVYDDYLGDYLVVANSDYSMGSKASISVIDVATGKDEPITDALITNPQKVAVADDGIYVLDWGNYADVAGGVRKITNSSVRTLFDATFASFIGTTIFACNVPWGSTPSDFIVYNIQSGNKNVYPAGVNRYFYPLLIKADPTTGHIFIASLGEEGSAGYKSNGYVIEYTATGEKLKEYECGVYPIAMDFSYAYERVEY
jgi:hypothetical protein